MRICQDVAMQRQQHNYILYEKSLFWTGRLANIYLYPQSSLRKLCERIGEFRSKYWTAVGDFSNHS